MSIDSSFIVIVIEQPILNFFPPEPTIIEYAMFTSAGYLSGCGDRFIPMSPLSLPPAYGSDIIRPHRMLLNGVCLFTMFDVFRAFSRAMAYVRERIALPHNVRGYVQRLCGRALSRWKALHIAFVMPRPFVPSISLTLHP